MLDPQYRRLNDEELGSAQRKLASSEQALKAARAGCDVRSERWTTNSRVVGHTLYDRPSPSPRRSRPRSLTRDAINARRTPPIGAHPIHDLTQSQKGACFSSRRHREPAQLLPRLKVAEYQGHRQGPVQPPRRFRDVQAAQSEVQRFY